MANIIHDTKYKLGTTGKGGKNSEKPHEFYSMATGLFVVYQATQSLLFSKSYFDQ